MLQDIKPSTLKRILKKLFFMLRKKRRMKYFGVITQCCSASCVFTASVRKFITAYSAVRVKAEQSDTVIQILFFKRDILKFTACYRMSRNIAVAAILMFLTGKPFKCFELFLFLVAIVLLCNSLEKCTVPLFPCVPVGNLYC